MAVKRGTHPRKKPVQSRSKATVDALLTATARVMLREGYDRTSTNKIAAEAGVSIGSLYQYFPSKEAIVGELVERLYNESLALLEPRLLGTAGQSLEATVAALVDAMLEEHRQNPELRRIIFEQVPRVGRLAKKLDYQSRIAELVVRGMQAHRERLGVPDPEMAAFMLVHAVEAVIHATLAKRPSYLKHAQLAREIRRLVLGYLTTAAS